MGRERKRERERNRKRERERERARDRESAVHSSQILFFYSPFIVAI